MSNIDVPEKYKENVESYIDKLLLEDWIEKAYERARNAYTYAHMRMIKDPEYLEEINKIEERFMEKYKKEYRKLVRSL